MASKETIVEMKSKGKSYSEIATSLGISVNTVKSIVKRANDRKAKEEHRCLNCGAKLEMTPKHRKKKFCSDGCRISFWRKNGKSLKEGKCKNCGRTIRFYPSKARSFCCRDCYLRFIGGKADEAK